jgi:hypothetical protein
MFRITGQGDIEMKITCESLSVCLFLFCLSLAKAEPLKSNIKGADNNTKSVWLSPKFHHPLACCDTLPTFTATGKAISILFQKLDTELSLPIGKGELSGSKVYFLDLPLNADHIGKKYKNIIADLRFGIFKPIGASVRIQTTIGETINVFKLDDSTDFYDDKLVALKIPVSEPLMRTQLPISVIVYIERKINEIQPVIQFDSLDVCLNDGKSRVCVDPKVRTSENSINQRPTKKSSAARISKINTK